MSETNEDFKKYVPGVFSDETMGAAKKLVEAVLRDKNVATNDEKQLLLQAAAAAAGAAAGDVNKGEAGPPLL